MNRRRAVPVSRNVQQFRGFWMSMSQRRQHTRLDGHSSDYCGGHNFVPRQRQAIISECACRADRPHLSGFHRSKFLWIFSYTHTDGTITVFGANEFGVSSSIFLHCRLPDFYQDRYYLCFLNFYLASCKKCRFLICLYRYKRQLYDNDVNAYMDKHSLIT